MNCRLKLIGSPEDKIYHLKDGVNNIGRSSNNDVQLVAEQVSRSHAILEVGQDKCVLKDLGSSNGTLVNGRRISSVSLNSGDEITVSGVNLRFEVAEEGSLAAHDFVPKVTADRSVFATIKTKAAPRGSIIDKIASINKPQESVPEQKKSSGLFGKLFGK